MWDLCSKGRLWVKVKVFFELLDLLVFVNAKNFLFPKIKLEASEQLPQ